MAKIKIKICKFCGEGIEVCERCEREDCDGKLYKTEYMRGSRGSDCGIRIVCRNHHSVAMFSGRLKYVLHGEEEGDDSFYYYIFPIEYSDEKVIKEAKKLRAEDEIKDKEREKATEKMLKERRKEKYIRLL